jgi:hypothetical protein
MLGDYFGNISGEKLAAIYAAGLMFGIGYNILTAWARRVGLLKGRTSLFVVAGVVITIALTAVINLPFALITAGEFIFTGTPMIVGDLWRAWRDEQEEAKRQKDMLAEIREELKHGDTR